MSNRRGPARLLQAGRAGARRRAAVSIGPPVPGGKIFKVELENLTYEELRKSTRPACFFIGERQCRPGIAESGSGKLTPRFYQHV